MEDRRTHRRIPFRRDVMLHRGNGQPCSLLAEDISLAGMRLYSERPFNVGDVLELHFDVRPRGRTNHLDMRARVQHVELERAGYLVGVGFLDKE